MTYKPTMDDARGKLLFAGDHIRERRVDDLAKHELYATLMTAINVWLLNRRIDIKTGYDDMFFVFIQNEHEIYERIDNKSCDVTTVYFNIGGLISAERAQELDIVDDWFESLEEIRVMCDCVINMLEKDLKPHTQ